MGRTRTLARSSNPVLNAGTFAVPGAAVGERMTIQGTVWKTFFLLFLAMATAAWTWSLFYTTRSVEAVVPWTIGGSIAGLILAIVTTFKRTWSPVTGPLYALAKGLLLGGLSSIFEARYPGIVIQAVGLTFAVLFSLLAIYTARLIRVTHNFRLIVASATMAIFLLYLVTFILSFFGIRVPFIHDSGPIGILFSLFVVGLAAANLVLDFDFIERGAEMGAPRYMEWYAAFGLIVTLIWLYLEILRLLSKLRSRD